MSWGSCKASELLQCQYLQFKVQGLVLLNHLSVLKTSL